MKLNLKSLALCAAMLSFGFADNYGVFGGELGGIIEQKNMGLFKSFESTYNSNEFDAKAAQYALPVNLGITIEDLDRGTGYVDYDATIDFDSIYKGDLLIGLDVDPRSIGISFDVNLNGIKHRLVISLFRDKYTLRIENVKGVQESEQTLADALRQTGLTVPLLCKGLLRLRDNWEAFRNRARNVGSTFTL